jgi:hypothetical protein
MVNICGMFVIVGSSTVYITSYGDQARFLLLGFSCELSIERLENYVSLFL